MSNLSSPHYIQIRQDEYARLKKLQRHFEDFWNYISYRRDINEAREDMRRGRTIPQEKLFHKLGL
ncbi:hypothetical protein HY504_01010 [Candidatus Wolfebacteria bacterium]|nr:hypothetical protein [Candidatus Wolfebacteria bacterium]